MSSALIDPNSPVSYVTGWADKTLVFSVIPNSARVCQVVSDGSEFPIAEPLTWVECDDQVVADQFYFEVTTNEFLAVPVPPPPVSQGDSV